VSGELEILAEPAPSGGKWYQIRLDLLTPDNLSIETSASKDVMPVSGTTDVADRATGTTYIEEPSTKPSEESRSESHVSPEKLTPRSIQRRSDASGLISQPKEGF
jgi:hypothetical protein